MKQSTFTDPDNYPAIVLSQPWAGLFWLSGFGWPGKLIESRTRRITYRGPLVICAGQKMDRDAWSQAFDRLVKTGVVPGQVFHPACTVLGAALAKINVVGCREFTPEDEAPAFFKRPKDDPPRFAWVPHDVAALDPFPTSGRQGFFRVPRELVDARVLARTIIEGIQ